VEGRPEAGVFLIAAGLLSADNNPFIRRPAARVGDRDIVPRL